MQPLPDAERLQLLALVAEDLARAATPPDQRPARSIMELHGVGRGSRERTDAQEHVNRLRGKMDDEPN